MTAASWARRSGRRGDTMSALECARYEVEVSRRGEVDGYGWWVK